MSATKQFYPQTGVAVTCRSFREYEAMFALEDGALALGATLDAAGGASSFAAEAAARGYEVAAADPRYALGADALYAESVEEIGVSSEKLERLKERYDWSFYGSLAAHRAGREASLAAFIRHYRESGSSGRGVYTAASLPILPFSDDMFALTLCSHFLFLYEEQFSMEFHLEALLELYRVTRPGGEVRVYPLQTLRFAPYPELERLIRLFGGETGAAVDMPRTRLPFIPGSERLLRIVKPAECEVRRKGI